MIALPPEAAAYAAMIGALLAGMKYVPLNAASPAARLHGLIRQVRPALIVGEADLPAGLDGCGTATRISPASLERWQCAVGWLGDEPMGAIGRALCLDQPGRPHEAETVLAAAPIPQCPRVQYLARESLSAAETILVYKHDPALSDGVLRALHAAARQYHPRAALFGVRTRQDGCPPGTLTRLGEPLCCGAVDHFSNPDICVDTWLALCRQVADDCGV
jgi:hypothetical protein